VTLVVNRHSAYLLRTPSDKRKVGEDPNIAGARILAWQAEGARGMDNGRSARTSARDSRWNARRLRASARPFWKCDSTTWPRFGPINGQDSNKSAFAAGIITPPMGAKTPSC
jgi:hypothetical protein